MAALTSACQDSDQEIEDIRNDRKDDMVIIHFLIAITIYYFLHCLGTTLAFTQISK